MVVWHAGSSAFMHLCACVVFVLPSSHLLWNCGIVCTQALLCSTLMSLIRLHGVASGYMSQQHLHAVRGRHFRMVSI